MVGFSHELDSNNRKTPKKGWSPGGEAGRDALRFDFDRSVKIENRAANVSSNAGLPAFRNSDEGLASAYVVRFKMMDCIPFWWY